MGKKKITIKEEFRNTIGISGGKFTKTDIFMSIVENNTFDDFWTRHCKFVQIDILTPKEIQKPYEDVNDAFVLYQVIKKEIQL
jgi:hypothetical protein